MAIGTLDAGAASSYQYQNLVQSDQCRLAWAKMYCVFYGKALTSTGGTLIYCSDLCMSFMSACKPDNTAPLAECTDSWGARTTGECLGLNGLTVAVPPPPPPPPTTMTTVITTTPAPGPCNNKFSGLTTCAVLNGLSYSTASAPAQMLNFEAELQQNPPRSAECVLLSNPSQCMARAYSLGLSVSTCEPVKMCFEYCVEVVLTCTPEAAESYAHEVCVSYPAEGTTGCMAKTGWVPSLTPWTPPPTPPPTTTVAYVTPPPVPFGNYSGLTTCSVLNGARMLDTSAWYILSVETAANYSYDTLLYLTKSDACRKAHIDVFCVQNSRTVTSTREDIQICYEWCLQYARVCGFGQGDSRLCDVSAPYGAECFGDNGVLGMKPVTTPPPTTTALLVTATPGPPPPPPPPPPSCPGTVSGLTECAVLEGMSTAGPDLLTMSQLETIVRDSYDAGNVGYGFDKSTCSRWLYYTWQCVTRSYQVGVCVGPYIREQLLACPDLCRKYYTECMPQQDAAVIGQYCVFTEYQEGWCFGIYGLQWQNASTPVQTTTTPTPTTTTPTPSTTTPVPTTTTTTPVPTTTPAPAPQICNNTYAGLTTCAVLNGARTARPDMQMIFEEQNYVVAVYNVMVLSYIANSEACKVLFYDNACFRYGKVCASTGFEMRLCLDTCVAFHRTCYPNWDNETVSSSCIPNPAPGAECFDFKCPVNSYAPAPLTLLSQCQCNTGFYGRNGSCSECPVYTNSNAASTSRADCVCRPGYGLNVSF